jgi:DNA (cytosine-5)-methyltransferase 1
MMEFDENITSIIKIPFLTCFDEIEEHNEDPFKGLTYLVYQQIRLRERKKTDLAAFSRDYSELNNIAHIIYLFNKHFSHRYKAKGAARLPVLAIYAIYSVMVEQVGRYNSTTLLPLQSHSAADERTGAVGDIEVAREDRSIFEALEIKHSIPITELLIDECARKIEGLGYKVDRYYILTTHSDCCPSPEMYKRLNQIGEQTGCQIVVNGVLPTIQYYLRLLTEPSLVFPKYLELLTDEAAIAHEHRIVWSKILTDLLP